MARRRGIHLHARDLAILEELLSRRAETLPYLHDRHFPGLTRKRARNRLGDLVAHGFLAKTALPAAGTLDDRAAAPRTDAVYQLGPKAYAALRLRSLAGEQLPARRVPEAIGDASIPHQLAVNRVGDALGVALIPETLLGFDRSVERRHRPDAAYRCVEADPLGRDLVFIEVDLGHYSRTRMLAKLRTFLDAPDARSILIATTSEERAELIGRWARDRHGQLVMERIQILTLDELAAGAQLDPGTEPAAAAAALPWAT